MLNGIFFSAKVLSFLVAASADCCCQSSSLPGHNLAVTIILIAKLHLLAHYQTQRQLLLLALLHLHSFTA